MEITSCLKCHREGKFISRSPPFAAAHFEWMALRYSRTFWRKKRFFLSFPSTSTWYLEKAKIILLGEQPGGNWKIMVGREGIIMFDISAFPSNLSRQESSAFSQSIHEFTYFFPIQTFRHVNLRFMFYSPFFLFRVRAGSLSNSNSCAPRNTRRNFHTHVEKRGEIINYLISHQFSLCSIIYFHDDCINEKNESNNK